MEAKNVRISGPLSPLDQFMPVTYTRLFLVFPTDNHESAVEALRAGLEKTCYQIPYIKGIIARQSWNRNVIGISWAVDTPTPELTHIPAPGFPSYSSLAADGAPLKYFLDSISPLQVRPKEESPAFASSYTQIDGGLILCVCVHHTLMDGTGFGEFVRVLAENTKGSFPAKERGLDNAEPMHRLYLLTGKDGPEDYSKGPTREQLLKKHPEFALRNKEKAASMSVTRPQAPSISRIFQIPLTKIEKAKELLMARHGMKDVTTYQVISALTWSAVCRARASRLQETAPLFSKVGFAVNGRKHLSRAVTEKMYMGNVNLFGLAILQREKLLKPAMWGKGDEDLESLIPILIAKSAAISRVTANHIAEVISIIQQSSDVRDITTGWNALEGLDLSMTSWMNMPVYDCDFGEYLGKPAFARPPYAEWDGLIIMLPRRRAQSKSNDDQKPTAQHIELIEVVVMLRQDDMEVLEKDELWTRWTREGI
jgi:transferase family protein